MNEETDIVSVKAKLDAKKRGLKHQSHNVWKDKSGQEYKWNKVLKRFERIENKSKEKKHFEFTRKTKKLEDGTVLHQIRATKDLPMHNVERGDVGGWIEKPENLSENAWVSGDAQVSGNAKISENKIINTGEYK